MDPIRPAKKSYLVRDTADMNGSETETGVPLSIAARQLRRHPATLRAWIRDGAPCVKLGRGAKGQGSFVDPEQLAAWYAARRLPAMKAQAQRLDLDRLALWLLDSLKRDSTGLGFPAHEAISLKPDKAAAYLFLVFKYLFLRIREQWPSDAELPEAARQLFAIAQINLRD